MDIMSNQTISLTPPWRSASALLITLVVALAGCGGGGDSAEPAPASDPRETSVTAASTLRWAGPGVDGIAITAITPAADGGLWVAGAEGGLEGRPFLRKVGGAAPNPCGGDGLRFLSEISGRFERRQGITSMTSVHDGAFYLSFQGPGTVFVARYLESTCAIETSSTSSVRPSLHSSSCMPVLNSPVIVSTLRLCGSVTPSAWVTTLRCG